MHRCNQKRLITINIRSHNSVTYAIFALHKWAKCHQPACITHKSANCLFFRQNIMLANIYLPGRLYISCVNWRWWFRKCWTFFLSQFIQIKDDHIEVLFHFFPFQSISLIRVVTLSCSNFWVNTTHNTLSFC